MFSQVTNLHPHAERAVPRRGIGFQKADRSPGIFGTLNPKAKIPNDEPGPRPSNFGAVDTVFD